MAFSSQNPHRQLRAIITDELRNAIQRGEYSPGQWLRQKDIAERFAVSQMPVREALKTLVAEGLVEHIPYRGARVVTLSADDIIDLHAQRAVLEGRAAAAATQRLSDAQIDHLQDIVTQMADHMATADLPLYRELNRQFHTLIYRSSKRAFLIRTLDRLWEVFPTMLWGTHTMTAYASLPDRDADDIYEHRQILEAIMARDAAAAEASMMRHISSAGQHFANALKATLSSQL